MPLALERIAAGVTKRVMNNNKMDIAMVGNYGFRGWFCLLRVSLICLAVVMMAALGGRQAGACGTVPGLVERYFEDPGNRLKAMSLLHCRSVVEKDYKGLRSEHLLLAKLIDSALKSPNSCLKDLAVKTFLLYDNLAWLEGGREYERVRGVVADRIGRDPGSINTQLGYYALGPIRHYCASSTDELHGLATGFRKSLGRYKQINEIRRQAVKELIKLGAQALNGPELERLLFKKHIQKNCAIGPEKAGSMAVILDGEGVFFRKGPSANAQIMTRYSSGARFIQTGQMGAWCHVVTRDCKEGWMACRYLKRSR